VLGQNEKHISELKRGLDGDALAREHRGQRHGQLVRQGSLIDQKSSSMLTYLAILLAGVSIFFVGADRQSESMDLMDILMMIEFIIVFAAAFLFLSCAKLVSLKAVLSDDVDEILENMHRIMSGRSTRFRLAFALTVIASAGFAVLIFFRILGTYFVGN